MLCNLKDKQSPYFLVWHTSSAQFLLHQLSKHKACVHTSLFCALLQGCILFPPPSSITWWVYFLHPGIYQHSSPTYFYKLNPPPLFFFFPQHLSHVAPPLFHFSHRHNHILVTRLQITTHTFPAQHRSSNPKQHFPLLLPSLPWEKIAIALEDSLSLEEIKHEKASDTSRTHHRCQAEALPKPSCVQLSATLSFRWDAHWHLSSFQLQLFICSAFCFKEK